MPTLNYRTEAIGVNILETVGNQVVYGLLSELDLTETFEQSVYIISSFMANSQYKDRDEQINLAGINRCDVEIAYVLDKSQVQWPVDAPYNTTAYGVRSINKGNHFPIFADEKAGILIEQQSVACGLSMKFQMNFATFDEATKAFDTIQSKYKGTLIQNPFSLAFSYPVTMSMFNYLVAVYNAKTDYKDKQFLDYINDMKLQQISFDVRRSELLNKEADVELYVRCQELNCLALLTMDQKEPDVNRVDQLPESFMLSFDLEIQFGRPSLISIHTPVSVDNTLLPYELFSKNNVNFYNNPDVDGIYENLALNGFLKNVKGDKNSHEITRLPVYDDWIHLDPQYRSYQYRPFFIAHFTLDGPVTTIDLKQLGTLELHPIIQAILKETRNIVFGYGGIFNISVFANELRLGGDLCTLSEDLILTVHSNRPDKVYHLIISETTLLKYTDPVWDDLLLKYRYFFPLTIERNIASLVDKRFFFIDYSNELLNLISMLGNSGKLKALLSTMIDLGEDTKELYAYTQTPSQLADYLSYTASKRNGYTLPIGNDAISVLVREFYTIKSSEFGRSLLVAFIEQCLIHGYVSLDTIPSQYLRPDKTIYPYYLGQGNYYGFNTPLRIINYDITTKRST